MRSSAERPRQDVSLGEQDGLGLAVGGELQTGPRRPIVGFRELGERGVLHHLGVAQADRRRAVAGIDRER